MPNEPPRGWRLRAVWPRPLMALRAGDAAALETAALVIRMVAGKLGDVGFRSLADSVDSVDHNPLLRFALRHDALTPALPDNAHRSLLKDVCCMFDLEQVNLSFDMLMVSDAVGVALWDHEDLMFFDTYTSRGRDVWEPLRLESGHFRFSQIVWDGQKDLASTISDIFGKALIPVQNKQGWVGAAMPVAFRVLFTPAHEVSFEELRSTLIVGPHIEVTDTGALSFTRREEHYLLFGVVRHRKNPDFELVRFYDDTGLPIAPPVVDTENSGRPYVSDDWRVGQLGFAYTLLYALGRPPFEVGPEFIPAEKLRKDWMLTKANSFGCPAPFPVPIDLGEDEPESQTTESGLRQEMQFR